MLQATISSVYSELAKHHRLRSLDDVIAVQYDTHPQGVSFKRMLEFYGVGFTYTSATTSGCGIHNSAKIINHIPPQDATPPPSQSFTVCNIANPSHRYTFTAFTHSFQHHPSFDQSTIYCHKNAQIIL